MLGLILLCLLTGAAQQDYRCGKVSNYWILLGTIIYFAAGYVVHIRGPSLSQVSLLTAYGGFIVCFISVTGIFLILFLFRMMGAGDIKVMALIGGYLGLYEGLLVIFYGLAAAAVWSLIFMLRKKILRKRITYFINFIRFFYAAGKPEACYVRDEDRAQVVFPFVPFLWLGLLVWLAKGGGV